MALRTFIAGVTERTTERETLLPDLKGDVTVPVEIVPPYRVVVVRNIGHTSACVLSPQHVVVTRLQFDNFQSVTGAHATAVIAAERRVGIVGQDEVNSAGPLSRSPIERQCNPRAGHNARVVQDGSCHRGCTHDQATGHAF